MSIQNNNYLQTPQQQQEAYSYMVGSSQNLSYNEIYDQSYSSRKELLKSSTKFENECIKTLTLCNRQSVLLSKTPKRGLIKHLNLLTFKIYQCKDAQCKNQKNCPYFHSSLDRRRSLVHMKYISDLCKQKEHCPQGDNCKFSHNHFESLYHPTKYKRRFCISYPGSVESCPYGNFCSYAHSEEEIGIKLLHNNSYDADFLIFQYKTHFCPFSHIPHNRSSCVYAHNWQDLRRSPYEHPIECVPCPNWEQKKFLRFYSEGCPQGSKCPYSHGWKEYEFHPYYYRVYPCEKGEHCSKKKDCPKFHNLEERRIVPKIVSSGFFVYVPANKLVSGTFKIPEQLGPVMDGGKIASIENLNQIEGNKNKTTTKIRNKMEDDGNIVSISSKKKYKSKENVIIEPRVEANQADEDSLESED